VAFPIISSKLRGVALSKISGLPITPFSNFTCLWANGTVGGCWAKTVVATKMKNKVALVIRKMIFTVFPPALL
jgi:hypothetical protein